MPGDSELLRAAAASEAALAPYAILGTEAEAAYDDLAQLASDLCDTPVALVTMFEERRQWFKAKVGFDGDETTIGDAICTNALSVDDVLIIPDLTLDPRTRDNVLVTGEPKLRFYAGAPLRVPDGTFLGTLCVIDFVARPAGLSPAQARGLRALADQVMALLELRRLVGDRDAAIAAEVSENRRLASSEAHWRGLFEGMREGFMVGEIVRDAAGRATDWRHLEVNPAFLNVIGLPGDRVVGQTVRAIAPNVPEQWITFVAGVIDRDEPATFSQVIGIHQRTYEGRAFPIGRDQFAVIFLDITEQIAADRRRAALIAVNDHLQDHGQIDPMTRAVAQVIGKTLGVKRAGFGRLDQSRETVRVAPDWTAPDVVSIEGRHRFADFGNLLNELLAGKPLVIDDVLTDPRTAADPGPMQSLAIASLVNVPVLERDETTAILFVHDDRTRSWSDEDVAFLGEVADRLGVAINKLEIESRRVVQNQELSHRVKNTLAMVQAIASQTLKPVTERSAVETFERRLTALATAHDTLLGNDWEVAPLAEVVRSVLDTAGQDDRFAIAGPHVDLSPRAVLSASLLIHELATNAVKYGSLSVPAGSVRISWTIRHHDGRPELHFEWTERGGPPASVPTRSGFGSRLIKMGLAGTGGVDLDYASAGFSARLSAPLDDLTKT